MYVHVGAAIGCARPTGLQRKRTSHGGRTRVIEAGLEVDLKTEIAAERVTFRWLRRFLESAAHALRSCANSGRLRHGIASLEASGGLPAVEAYFTFIPYETRRNRKQLPGTLLLHRISLVRCPQPRPRPPTTTLHDGRAAATASAALSPPTHPAPVTGLLVHCTPQPAPGCAAEPNSLPPSSISARGCTRIRGSTTAARHAHGALPAIPCCIPQRSSVVCSPLAWVCHS